MSTQGYDLEESRWTDIGPPPCLIQSISVYPVRFVISDAVPEAVDAPAHYLDGLRLQPIDIDLPGQRVFARAGQASGATIVVSNAMAAPPVVGGLDLSRPLGVDLIPVT